MKFFKELSIIFRIEIFMHKSDEVNRQLCWRGRQHGKKQMKSIKIYSTNL